ncbi:MAG: glycoside hydrolase [Sulfobacillus acidophilus]|uniref:Glycoside hydrolase n=1 Tax=Sulfobacillus acidophilus TaxID=53633 RepID=A0A2T2WLJ5_9FIRM|nr:MAG: glycoside hydrolase [Sulfobacillus acidophilus]
MASSVAFYLLLHQPLRFRIPLDASSKNMPNTAKEWQRHLFDDVLNARYFKGIAERSYVPMLSLIEELIGRDFHCNLGLSWTFWEQAQAFGEPLLSLLIRVLRHPNIEIIGVEPYHSLLPLIDPHMFQRRMRWMREKMQQTFQKSVCITDTTEMFYSDQIYWSLALAGFDAMLVDGRPNTVGAQGPTGIYNGPGPLAIIPRHWSLSDDVGYRFSNRSWDRYPLYAPDYAQWLTDAPGAVAMVGWDFETFGEHHRKETGIFAFMRQLKEELDARAVPTVRLSTRLNGPRAGILTPPLRPLTWAGTGDLNFFLGNRRQWELYQHMQSVYHKARLTERAGYIDVALRLMQSDHLHMLHWYDAQGPEADVSMYFTPGEWWAQGRDAIIAGLNQVFEVFSHGLDEPLLQRLSPTKTPRSHP